MSVYRAISGVMAAAVAAVSLTGVAAQAVEPDIDFDRHAEAVERSARQELSPQPSEEETRRHALVRQAFEQETAAGSWSAIKGKTLKLLHVREAAVDALAKNLTIESARDERAKAAHAIDEARAVFDPVFSLAVNYDESQTFRRAKIGKINKRDFNPTNIGGIPVANSPGVTGINFRTQQEAFGVSQEIEASKDSEEGPTRVLTYSVAVDQQLPWGPRFSLAAVTKEQKIYYRKGYYWTDGKYSSTLTLNLNSGVPGGRGFGPFAPADAALLLQEQARKRTEWTLKRTINDVLLSTDLAYWALVRSVEELQVSVDNGDLVRRQMERIQRLFSLQRATNYQKAEIEAEFARANVQVESARNFYVTASNNLAVLIENKVEDVQSQVYLPFGYTRPLQIRLRADLNSAMAAAKQYRPDFFIDRINREGAGISLQASETAARPNISFGATLKHEQNGTQFGYRDIWESVSHLNRPDIIDQTYALSLSRPLGNQAALANVDRARLSVRDQDAVKRRTIQIASQEIKDQLATMGSARTRLGAFDAEIARLENSLDGLRRRQEIGADVTQNEIILTIRSLLSARLNRISALIDNKVAESRLLAAQGTLAQEYGVRTVFNDLDKRRIEGLASQGFLSYFLPLSAGPRKAEP